MMRYAIWINKRCGRLVSFIALGVVLFAGLHPGSARAFDTGNGDDSINQLDSRRVAILRRAFINPKIGDSQSVQFRDLFVSSTYNICGKANFRNQFGRWSGFVPFSVDASARLEILDRSVITPELTRIKINQACRKPL